MYLNIDQKFKILINCVYQKSMFAWLLKKTGNTSRLKNKLNLIVIKFLTRLNC